MGIPITVTVLITGISGHWSPAEAVHTFHADAGVHRDLHLAVEERAGAGGGRSGRPPWESQVLQSQVLKIAKLVNLTPSNYGYNYHKL